MGGQDEGNGHRQAAVTAERRYLEAKAEMLSTREPLLLEAWFLMKQRDPDAVFSVRQQTWSSWDTGRLLVVLNVMRLMAEGHSKPLALD